MKPVENANALRSELNWTHYRSLMRVEDEDARDFYLEETVKCGWSSRQLDRQINSFYYQRILASKDKGSVSEEIDSLEPKPEYEKITCKSFCWNSGEDTPLCPGRNTLTLTVVISILIWFSTTTF